MDIRIGSRGDIDIQILGQEHFVLANIIKFGDSLVQGAFINLRQLSLVFFEVVLQKFDQGLVDLRVRFPVV